MNKVWQKPKLIILYRGRQEECLLLGCKATLIPGGNKDANNNCLKNNCTTCKDVLVS